MPGNDQTLPFLSFDLCDDLVLGFVPHVDGFFAFTFRQMSNLVIVAEQSPVIDANPVDIGKLRSERSLEPAAV